VSSEVLLLSSGLHRESAQDRPLALCISPKIKKLRKTQCEVRRTRETAWAHFDFARRTAGELLGCTTTYELQHSLFIQGICSHSRRMQCGSCSASSRRLPVHHEYAVNAIPISTYVGDYTQILAATSYTLDSHFNDSNIDPRARDLCLRRTQQKMRARVS
jgi:hypothetical protein